MWCRNLFNALSRYQVSRILGLLLFLYFPMTVNAEYHHVSSCTVCHDFVLFGGSNLRLIGEVIQTPNSGPKPVVFTSHTPS